MAATTTPITKRSKSDYTFSITEINLGTYATGGIAVAPEQVGLKRIDHAIVLTKTTSGSAAGTGISLFNPTTKKIMLYSASLGDETTNATDCSAVTFTMISFMFGG